MAPTPWRPNDRAGVSPSLRVLGTTVCAPFGRVQCLKLHQTKYSLICDLLNTGMTVMILDLLILGAGWTSTFLIPLCKERGVSYAATSRGGRDDTIAFEFDPHSVDPGPFQNLPNAKTVLITFPIKVPGASERLVKLYRQTHGEGPHSAFIQLGSTGIWDVRRIPSCSRFLARHGCHLRFLYLGRADVARWHPYVDGPSLQVR